LRSASSPLIHIFAGEKVCIQDAARVLVGLAHRPPDGGGVGEHRLPHHPDRHLGGLVERRGDPLRLLGDLLQGLLAVQPLAAGQEPDLVRLERVVDHGGTSPHCP
jgi:hypothetical protein